MESSLQLWGRSWGRIGLAGAALGWGEDVKSHNFNITVRLLRCLHGEAFPAPKEGDG